MEADLLKYARRTTYWRGRLSAPHKRTFGGPGAAEIGSETIMQSRDYAVGDSIAGSYRVLRIFGGAGASGMGVVYLVNERDEPEPFVMKACQGGDATLMSRFKREAEVWVKIGSHPNVTKAFWVRHLDEQLFVAAEYVSGVEAGFGSLADMVGMDVAPQQVIRWAMQFCSGLGHALARGLIAHRDVKPANLLLTRQGDLKIADFGLGKTLPLGALAPDHLAMGSTGITGTPPYMAPEQIVGEATDCRCDIYAFGIVLYQLCSPGAYPYEVIPPMKASSFAAAHLRGRVRPLASPFWPVIEKCLKRSARDRWQSPEDLGAAIRKAAVEIGLPCPPFVAPQPVGLEELYAKAQSLTALGKPEDALVAIGQYLGKAPDAFWAWTEKGRILLELNRNAAAEEATRRSLALDSTNSHAWNNLGLSLQRLGRSEESCSAYDRALECDPLNGGAMMNAAQALCALERYDRAAALICAALRLTPKKQTLLFNAGNLVSLMLQGHAPGPAETVARALISLDTSNSQAWHNLGVLLTANGKRKEGLQCVRAALQHEPGNADSRLFLARACGETGLIDEAIAHLDRLIVDRQHLEKAVCFKAQLLAHKGMGGEAILLLETFLEEAPADDSAWFILCSIAETEGDIAKALRAARACETILQRRGAKTDSDNVRWARSKVQELRARMGT